MSTYRVTRFYLRNDIKHVIAEGLTLTEAKEHCENPETSSATCTSASNVHRTQLHGPWFDGYTKEQS